MDVKEIEALDEVAARAVPGSELLDVGGWVARCSPGLAAKRANSVWPRAHFDDDEIDEKLATVERFYADRGVSSRYQVSPAAQPHGLEGALRERGYVATAPTAVLRCALASIVAWSMPPRATIRIEECASVRWWAAWKTALGIDPARLTAVAALFDRVSTRTAFVTVAIESVDAAVALGVLEGNWLGVFNMATLPQQRRRGAARTAVVALADWAGQRGATTSYLQVDLENRPALDLYRAIGFQQAYRYVYLGRDRP